MIINQVNKAELEISKQEGDKTFKKYILIDSEEGQDLIKEHGIVIDPDIEEI